MLVFREERNQTQVLRQQQDEAYLASLRADQEKDRKKREEEEQLRQEEEKVRQTALAEERRRRVSLSFVWRDVQPNDPTKGWNVSHIAQHIKWFSLCLPSGHSCLQHAVVVNIYIHIILGNVIAQECLQGLLGWEWIDGFFCVAGWDADILEFLLCLRIRFIGPAVNTCERFE